MNILVTDEQNFLITNYTKFSNSEGEYFYIPYWFKKLKTINCFEQLSFDELPLWLKEMINEQKNEKLPIKE